MTKVYNSNDTADLWWWCLKGGTWAGEVASCKSASGYFVTPQLNVQNYLFIFFQALQKYTRFSFFLLVTIYVYLGYFTFYRRFFILGNLFIGQVTLYKSFLFIFIRAQFQCYIYAMWTFCASANIQIFLKFDNYIQSINQVSPKQRFELI